MFRDLLSFLLSSKPTQDSAPSPWIAGPWITVRIEQADHTSTARPVLKTPKALYRYVSPLLANQDREYVLSIPLSLYRPLGINLVSIGTTDFVSVHPREVFKVLLHTNADSFAIVHNYPDAPATPSELDWSCTERIVQCGALMGIPLYEHLVIGTRDYYSFREQSGLIQVP